MKRILVLLLAFSLTASLFAKGGTETGGTGKAAPPAVKIAFMNSKGEIQAQLEEAAKLFSSETPGVSLELLATPVGQSPWEKVMALYASGNAPVLFMDKITSFLKIKEKLADLTNEKWAKDIIATPALDLAKPGEKLIAFPFTVEGYGLIYNKSLLDKAGVNPGSIRTIKDLEAAFEKVRAAGIGVVTVAKDDWSVGGHYLYTAYSQTKNQAGWEKLQADLKSGSVDLSRNQPLNGLLDTFDLLKKYNVNASDPMAPSYDAVNGQFAAEKAAFYFQGNWVWPILSKLTKVTHFAFLPVPTSNDPADYGNSGIPVSITKFIAVDKEQNTPEQQAAARKFLDWMVYSASGQDALVNRCSMIPAFRNVALMPQDPLSQSVIRDYISKDRTIFWPQTPSDHWAKLGVFMQKYLANVISREELLKEIRNYWMKVK